MRATWRAGTRTGLVFLTATSLTLFVAPSVSAAEEETGTKNLSSPVILVDDDTMSAAFNPVTVPAGPTGNADYTKDSLNYYTGVGSDTYTSTIDDSFDADTWGADWVSELANPVVADAKWGDNLLSHVFPGNRKMPIRVEVNLFANADTAATYGEMLGYTTVSLEGEHDGELFGTLGVAEALTPMVYTPDATLTILRYDADSDWYSTVILPATPMTGEVNGSGKLIYGFNWGSSSGLPSPDAGNYRLIFTVGDASLVTLGEALIGDDSEGEGPVHTPYIYGEKVTYLDIAVGTSAINPPLPFVEPLVKSDFTGDRNPDVIARDSSGRLYLYPGDGEGAWLPKITYGTGWNAMTTLTVTGDFDGDSFADLMATDTTGALWLYPGDGAGGWLPRTKIGSGWTAMQAVAGPGDFDGDSFVDLFAKDSAGRLYLYRGNGDGGWLPRIAYGTGWNPMIDIFSTGDFNGDSHADLLVRDGTGALWLYPGDGAGGWLPRTSTGTGWSAMTAMTGPGDFDGDRKTDALARNSLGQLLLYRGDGTGGWLTPAGLVGSGWNGMTAIVS